MSLGICFKKLHLVTVGTLLDEASKVVLFSVSSLKDEKLIKKHRIILLISSYRYYTISKLVHYF